MASMEVGVCATRGGALDCAAIAVIAIKPGAVGPALLR